MKFSIRDLFLVTMVVALVVGWAIDHQRLRSPMQLRLKQFPYPLQDIQSVPR